MAKETGSGSKPTADTKTAAAEAAAKYNSSSSSSSSKTSSSSTKTSTASSSSKTNYSPYSSTKSSSSAKSTPQSLVSSGGSTRSSSVSYSPSKTPASSLTSSGSSSNSGSSKGNMRGSDPDASMRRTGVSASGATNRARSSANPTAEDMADLGRQLAVLKSLRPETSEDRMRKSLEEKREGMDPVSGFFYDPWKYLFQGPDTPDITYDGPDSAIGQTQEFFGRPWKYLLPGEDTPRPTGDGTPILDALQAPYRRRVERAGGAPFEGPVDWGGIAAALFGGQSAEERDAAMAAGRRGPDPSRFTPLGEENLGLSYGMLNDMFLPEVDPESGFIRDPDTGTFYSPGSPQLSSSPARLAEGSAPSLMDAWKPLEGLFDGIQAEQRRLNGEVDPESVPLPRRDPRPPGTGGIADMAIPLPGQTESPNGAIDITVPYESDEARYARTNPVEKKKEPTVWDQVVEGSGKLLENTTIGGVVKHLFPDIWYGGGEMMKGMDDGLTYGGSGIRTNFEDTANGGSLIEQPTQYAYAPPAVLPFPDLNGNGIDDRLEGYTPPTGTSTSNVYDRFGDVVFPDMPPYNPGRDNEWLYFRRRMANGGMVGYADGGIVDAAAAAPPQDPRIEIIAAAEDALENAIAGAPEPDDEADLAAFIETFGEGALEQLKANVAEGMKMRPKRSAGRMIAGPGGPKEDMVPAVVDDGTPVALSNGEYVVPADAVAAAGDGDPMAGAAALDELSARLAAR